MHCAAERGSIAGLLLITEVPEKEKGGGGGGHGGHGPGMGGMDY